MREFKFRGWNNKIQFMSKPFRFGQVLNFNDQIIKSLSKDEIVMQFTGLKDKNGVDIYDGDYLSNNYNAKGVVSFVNGMFVVKFTYEETLLTKDGETAYFRLCTVNLITDIIGNIYENPKLLNE